MNQDSVFQNRFASIMEILLNAAMAETAKLYESCVLELRAEISRVQAENNTLKCRIIQTSEATGYSVQSDEWLSENEQFFGRPSANSGPAESGPAEVITPEQHDGREGTLLIKEETSGSELICQILPKVDTEADMKMAADPSREWGPVPNAIGLGHKEEIKLESSPEPVCMEMSMMSSGQKSTVATGGLKTAVHTEQTSKDQYDQYDQLHSVDQQHVSRHGIFNSRAQCEAPLTPTENTLSVNMSTRHYDQQSKEHSDYFTSLHLPNRQTHTPSTISRNATRTFQKTLPVRHLPINTLARGSQHRCKDCGKTFSSRRGLCGHQQVHQGERSHQCSHCGKSFLYQSSLAHHLKSHTGKDSYSCTLCRRKFVSKANLTVHLVSHTKEHPFQCRICGLTFGNRAVYRTHLKSHSGEPRYTCTQCGKKFLDLGNFSRHKRIHTGERPYSCEVCGKSFIQSAHLKKHVRTHR